MGKRSPFRVATKDQENNSVRIYVAGLATVQLPAGLCKVFKFCIPFLVLVLLFIATSPSVSAQTLVLRDLTLVPSARIRSLQEEGLQLADGRTFGWDEILRAEVGTRWQDDVDDYLKTIGQPLFRLKKRISDGDFALAAEIAPLLQKSSNPQVRFLSNRALMLNLAQRGQPEAAVPHMFRAMLAQQAIKGDVTGDAQSQSKSLLKELMFSDGEFKTIVPKLLPVFGDSAAAVEALDQISAMGNERVLVKKIPVAAVYLNLLGAVSQKFNKNLPLDAKLRHWRAVVGMAAREIPRQSLTDMVANKEPDFRVTAMFYFSQSEKNANLQQRILTLLKITAGWQETFPQVAQLSLEQATKIAKGSEYSESLRKTLETLSAK